MAITPGEQVDIAREALRDLTEDGRAVSHAELAMAYMRRHPAFLRRQRRINEFREFFLMEPSEGPSTPPWRYRHQTSLAIMAMEEEGSVGSVFVDPETGEPLEDPTPPLDYRNKRYFPAGTADDPEPAPPAEAGKQGGTYDAPAGFPLAPPTVRRDPGHYIM